jgi:hypothetical protein
MWRGPFACHNTHIVSRRASVLLPLIVGAILLATVDLRADDGAASIAAGGIVVMKREPRITMAKEVLQISTSKVTVDYDFRNDSNDDITTGVAFPIPDYELDQGEFVPSQQSFDDFKLWVNGSPVRFLIEARAFLKDIEYTQLLTSMNVDVASLGHVPIGRNDPPIGDIQRLTAAQRDQLEKAGLIDHGNNFPLWTVKKKYYWQQTFPARSSVHIRHEYSPVVGSENSVAYGMGADANPRLAKEIASFCLDGRLRTALQGIANGTDKNKSASYRFVDFILTTANTWKMPIEDFTLIVERSHEKNYRGEADLADYVSFCWDGPVTRIDPDQFSAHAINLVPKKDLRVGFFGVGRP